MIYGMLLTGMRIVEKVDSPIGDENNVVSGEFKNATIVEKVDSPIGDENLSHQIYFLQLTPGRESRFPDRGRKLARIYND